MTPLEEMALNIATHEHKLRRAEIVLRFTFALIALCFLFFSDRDGLVGWFAALTAFGWEDASPLGWIVRNWYRSKARRRYNREVELRRIKYPNGDE